MVRDQIQISSEKKMPNICVSFTAEMTYLNCKTADIRGLPILSSHFYYITAHCKHRNIHTLLFQLFL